MMVVVEHDLMEDMPLSMTLCLKVVVRLSRRCCIRGNY
jgi:hypothetical protein